MARGIRRLGLGGRSRRTLEEREPESLQDLLDALPLTLRRQALTHSSWVDHRADSYGRLAFLGDSVLGLAIAEHLFSRYPRADIGRLTKMHGQAVSGRACAEVAIELGVPELLREAAPERVEGGIEVDALLASERALASVCEAVIGACYMHHGFEVTSRATVAAFRNEIEIASERLLDFKSALQERLAREGARVRYEVTGESGPPHDRVFEVAASVSGEVVGHGSGRSKKAAEQAAAERAMEALA
ncbi:MAG TPA: ribonuclease III domain-containing protein [Solirubrobacterales bacterium]|jgi:ribonuclease-3